MEGARFRSSPAPSFAAQAAAVEAASAFVLAAEGEVELEAGAPGSGLRSMWLLSKPFWLIPFWDW